jgi:hypothetical protein
MEQKSHGDDDEEGGDDVTRRDLPVDDEIASGRQDLFVSSFWNAS